MTGARAVAGQVSRRGLLASATAAAVAGLVSSDENQSPEARLLSLPKPRSAGSSPVTAAPAASPAPLQSRPIFNLAQYRKVVPGEAFPANAVALTIDDGPHPVWTPKLLTLLERYHVPATFFMIGNQVRGHENVARSVVAAGHQVANHTYSHPIELRRFSPVDMHKEIARAQDKIYSTTGYAPKLFRSPGGGWSPPLLAQAAQAGMVPIDWSDDPSDWKRPGTEVIARRLLAAKPGQILLCHDGGGDRSQTYAALQTVIPALLARGYTFVSL